MNRENNQKIYYLAEIVDYGEVYNVVSLTTSLVKEFLGGNNYIGLNRSTAILIEQALNENKLVQIDKNHLDIEVMPRDLIIKDNKTNDLQNHKNIIITKIRQLVNHQQAIVSGIHLYDFIMINTILADKGFHIHEDNREEKYLEILETGDEQLIDKLEIYLNAMDIVSRASSIENKYLKFYNDINDCENIQEVDSLYNKMNIFLQDTRS
jgi:hypothetical protein